jgi:hypothetical protein
MVDSEQKDMGLVGFYCPSFNRTIEITHPPSLTVDPTAASHPERKMAKFNNGLFSTDDPEIIAVLDARPDVYRMDDPRVQALEEVASMEPEDKIKALRLLEKVGSIGDFDKPKARVPGVLGV